MKMRIGAPQQLGVFASAPRPECAPPGPGPGNGCRYTISRGRPSSTPMRRTSSLNSSRSGSTSCKIHVRRQAADVVVRFDDVRLAGLARRPTRSRPDRSCPAPGTAYRAACAPACSNTSMNSRADDLALLLRIAHARAAPRGNAAAAFTRITCTPSASAKVRMTWSPSPSRSRP